MTLYARPTDAELLARLNAHSAPAQTSDRKCGFCKTPMAATDVTCPKCFREPLEKSEQSEVMKLYRAYGCNVYNLSQPRATKQTPGIPDLWVVRRAGEFLGTAWWHETKRPVSGKPSSAQVEFREECEASGIVYRMGGLAVARQRLVDIGAARWVDGHDGGDIEPARI